MGSERCIRDRETTLNNIPPGERDIYVRLMNNDHTPIEPKIVDRIRINVQ